MKDSQKEKKTRIVYHAVKLSINFHIFPRARQPKLFPRTKLIKNPHTLEKRTSVPIFLWNAPILVIKKVIFGRWITGRACVRDFSNDPLDFRYFPIFFPAT